MNDWCTVEPGPELPLPARDDSSKHTQRCKHKGLIKLINTCNAKRRWGSVDVYPGMTYSGTSK